MDSEEKLTRLWNDGLEGDARAYESALLELSRVLRAYLRRRLPWVKNRSEEWMEDLVQDVLISLHTKRHTYRAGLPVLPWAYAITRHRMIDYLRMLKVRPKTVSLLDEETGWDAAEIRMSLQQEEENRDREKRESDQEQLLSLFDSLSPQQKEVLRLAKLEDQPLHAIADSLQLSLANVKVTVHRAVKRLQTLHLQRKGGRSS